jgi:ribonuclease P protein component
MVLPKHMRLKGHRCFDFIYKQGSRFYSPSMVLRVTSANTKPNVKGKEFLVSVRMRSHTGRRVVRTRRKRGRSRLTV